MNRDPFETLRARNPAPPESLPAAPMTVATRITTSRPSVRRGLAIAAAAATVVLVGGGGWLVWSQTGGRQDVVATTATTVTAAPDGVTVVAEDAPTVVVYFFADGSLLPVARDLSVLDVIVPPDLGPLAVNLLLRGPGAGEALPDPVAAAEAQLTTAIPEGTRVLGVTLADGIAHVDLSAEFAAAPPQAIAQVVYTLTRLEGVNAVGFVIDGVPQVIGSLTSGLFTPYLEPAAAGAGLDSIDRDWLAMYQSDLMIEYPALGGTLPAGEAVRLLTRGPLTGADALLTLTAADGTLLWNALWTAAEPAYLPPEIVEAVGGGAWAFLQATGAAGGAAGAAVEIPVWLAPLPDEPTTTTVTAATTTTVLTADAAPWSRPPLDAAAVPFEFRETWASTNHAACAVLFPEDPASLAPDTVPVLHERYFGGDWGWGLAWDLPSGPGRWEPGGEYCADCGREAFGVAGTTFPGLDYTEDAIWANRLAWPDGSHAGYGYEGLNPTGAAGEPMLAYLFVDGQGCLYNVWSFLGEDHLLALISQLRFVTGMQGSGAPGEAPDLGVLRPFPADMLTGCAAGTARHLEAFTTALEGGALSLPELCAIVGMPDWETGSGLLIPAYDLADGSRLYLGYGGLPSIEVTLLYAHLVSPYGTTRDLLEG